jgi:hypothetical protein
MTLHTILICAKLSEYEHYDALGNENRYFAWQALGHTPNLDELYAHYWNNTRNGPPYFVFDVTEECCVKNELSIAA